LPEVTEPDLLRSFLLQELLADVSREFNDLDTARPALRALAVAAQGLALGVVVDDREAVRGALRATV
jgi:hypothetical protein